jgi:hypothetical protein
MFCLVVVFGILSSSSPVEIAIAAAGRGWEVRDSNALRSRPAPRTFFSRYIDWHRVEADSSRSNAQV